MNADRNHPGTAGPATEIDTSVAHPARVYDYWLGGKDNFAAGREAAERVLAGPPGSWPVRPACASSCPVLHRAGSGPARAGVRAHLAA